MSHMCQILVKALGYN